MRLDAVLGKPCLCVGDQRRSDACAVRLGRHEKLIQFITLEDIEADRCAKRTGNMDVRKCGLQSLAKALKGAEAGQLWRQQWRVSSVPAVIPQPREMIDLSGVG